MEESKQEAEQPRQEYQERARQLEGLGGDQQQAGQVAHAVSQRGLNHEAVLDMVRRYGPGVLDLIRKLLAGSPEQPSPTGQGSTEPPPVQHE
jgi:hypothetical protein